MLMSNPEQIEHCYHKTADGCIYTDAEFYNPDTGRGTHLSYTPATDSFWRLLWVKRLEKLAQQQKSAATEQTSKGSGKKGKPEA